MVFGLREEIVPSNRGRPGPRFTSPDEGVKGVWWRGAMMSFFGGQPGPRFTTPNDDDVGA